jgi:hypothetical protein
MHCLAPCQSVLCRVADWVCQAALWEYVTGITARMFGHVTKLEEGMNGMWCWLLEEPLPRRRTCRRRTCRRRTCRRRTCRRRTCRVVTMRSLTVTVCTDCLKKTVHCSHTLYLCFRIVLKINRLYPYFPIKHYVIGLSYGIILCSLWCTNWIFVCNLD